MTVIDKAASPRKKPLAKTIRGALLGGIVGGGSMAVLLPLLEGDLHMFARGITNIGPQDQLLAVPPDTSGMLHSNRSPLRVD